ncbi:MAG: hypothetical protein KA586_01130 [Candidatus Promineofilum sp.]|nr:hypothetical protein [Promineifilum sp.]
MTRLWSKAVVITVQSSSDSPERLTWERQTHNVAAVVKRWRVGADWWRGEAVARDYYKVTTTTGLLIIIYRDLQTGTWYLQRLYD